MNEWHPESIWNSKRIQTMNNWDFFNYLNRIEKWALKLNRRPYSYFYRIEVSIEMENRKGLRHIINIWRQCKYNNVLTKLSVPEDILNSYQ